MFLAVCIFNDGFDIILRINNLLLIKIDLKTNNIAVNVDYQQTTRTNLRLIPKAKDKILKAEKFTFFKTFSIKV